MIDTQKIEQLRNAINTRFPELEEMHQMATIKCLDLTLRREYAEQIAAGIKTVEYRWPIPFWEKRFENENVWKFLDKYESDYWNLVEQVFPDFKKETFSLNILRKTTPFVNRVETIHFHNYNTNGWKLTVECTYNNFCEPDNEGKEWLHSFNSFEQDEEFDEWERNTLPITKK